VQRFVVPATRAQHRLHHDRFGPERRRRRTEHHRERQLVLGKLVWRNRGVRRRDEHALLLRCRGSGCNGRFVVVHVLGPTTVLFRIEPCT
jgi:hypothetical protein